MSLLLLAEFALVGALLAEIDRIEDGHRRKSEGVAIVLAAIASSLMAYLIITDFGSAIIFSAILMGVLFAGKVDNLPFLIGMLIASGGVLVRILYANFLDVLLLPVSLAFCAFVDEYGNDRIRKIDDNLMRWFFLHRFTLKLAIFIVAYYGLISGWHFFAFLAFDFAYEYMARR